MALVSSVPVWCVDRFDLTDRNYNDTVGKPRASRPGWSRVSSL